LISAVFVCCLCDAAPGDQSPERSGGGRGGSNISDVTFSSITPLLHFFLDAPGTQQVFLDIKRRSSGQLILIVGLVEDVVC
jgi:hypothetical protein